MAKQSKATKKFQSKHLKHMIEHRKEVQKQNKKWGQRKDKSKKNGENEVRSNGNDKEVFEDMPVDEFFERGFQVPKKKLKKENLSEEESSSEEEDGEAMQKDMEDLQLKDPEFYKYLQENDKELLNFEGVNPLDAISDDEDSEDNEEEEIEKKTKPVQESKGVSETKKVEITNEILKEWYKQLEKPSVKLIKNITVAFKAAVNISKAHEEDYKYTITDPDVFNELTMLTLRNVPDAIKKMVKYKKHANSNARIIPEKNPNAKQLGTVLKSHAASYLILLNGINNTETAALVLSSLQELLPYYLSHRRLLKEILSSVINIWTSATEVETQIAAFAFLNNSTREFPKSLLENVLKFTYSIFLQNCRKTNIHTMPMINFCKNSAAELFGIDENVSYQVGFEYVRQLAIHLRNSISATSNAKEGYKAIYNWQYCHSLDFWSRILAKQCNPENELLNHKSKQSPLRQLIYPLVQVTLGAIRLIPTAQFFPLRFYLIRSLIRLSQSSGVFIPIFPLISEILSSTAFTKSPKNVNLPSFDMEHNIKANKAYLGTKIYQEGLCEQFIELVGEFFVLHCKSIAYPELVTPPVIALRRFLKTSKNVKFNKQLAQLVEKLNANATFILGKRSNVSYGPSNKAEVELFLKDFSWEKTPLGQYVSVQRQLKEERLAILKEAVAEEERSRLEKAKEEEDTSDIDMNDLDESESESEGDASDDSIDHE